MQALKVTLIALVGILAIAGFSFFFFYTSNNSQASTSATAARIAPTSISAKAQTTQVTGGVKGVVAIAGYSPKLSRYNLLYYSSQSKPQPTPGMGTQVFGGTESPDGEAPYYVAIYVKDYWSSTHQFVCGGSYIGNGWVLTAGHCKPYSTADTPDRYKVVIGDTNTIDRTPAGYFDLAPTAKAFSISEVHVAPGFNVISLNNDVRLLKLVPRADIPFTSLTPIVLNMQRAYPLTGGQVTIYGHGATGGSPVARTLQKAVIPATNLSVLDGTTVDHNLWFTAGGGGVDTCNRDSGGPAVYGGKLTGLTSWGGACGGGGAYTRVSTQLDWICSKTNLSICSQPRPTAIRSPTPTPSKTPTPMPSPMACVPFQGKLLNNPIAQANNESQAVLGVSDTGTLLAQGQPPTSTPFPANVPQFTITASGTVDQFNRLPHLELYAVRSTGNYAYQLLARWCNVGSNVSLKWLPPAGSEVLRAQDSLYIMVARNGIKPGTSFGTQSAGPIRIQQLQTNVKVGTGTVWNLSTKPLTAKSDCRAVTKPDDGKLYCPGGFYVTRLADFPL